MKKRNPKLAKDSRKTVKVKYVAKSNRRFLIVSLLYSSGKSYSSSPESAVFWYSLQKQSRVLTPEVTSTQFVIGELSSDRWLERLPKLPIEHIRIDDQPDNYAKN